MSSGIDNKTLEFARRNFCQSCGNTRGADIYNINGSKIALCYSCRGAVHRGEINIDDIKNNLSLDTIMQAYCEGREQEDEGKWKQAAALVVIKHNCKWSNRKIGAEVGISGSSVRDMIRTFMAFPDENMRAKDLHYTHHRIAAMTPEPEHWIEQSIINGWSCRQLQETVKRGKLSPEAEHDYLLGKAEKIVRLTKEVLAEGGDIADWLKKELSVVLSASSQKDSQQPEKDEIHQGVA